MNVGFLATLFGSTLNSGRNSGGALTGQDDPLRSSPTLAQRLVWLWEPVVVFGNASFKTAGVNLKGSMGSNQSKYKLRLFARSELELFAGILAATTLAVLLVSCGPNYFAKGEIHITPSESFERDQRIAEGIITRLGFTAFEHPYTGQVPEFDQDQRLVLSHFRLPENPDLRATVKKSMITGQLVVSFEDSSIGGFDFKGRSKDIVKRLGSALKDAFGEERLTMGEATRRHIGS